MSKFLVRTALLATLLALGACNNHEDDPWSPVPQSSYGVRTLESVDQPSYFDRTQATSDNSAAFFLISVVFGVGGMLALSAFFWWSSRRRAKLEENFDPNAPLRDGVSVVFGRVETEDGGPAVVLRVDQRAREWQYKGQWNHVWEEVQRQQHVRPFVVRTANGTTVRVEPPQGVMLQGEFTSIVRHNHFERTQVFEIKNGAELHVYGMLSGAAQQSTTMAYRAGQAMPVLVATNTAPMVISTEKPGATARSRAKVHRNVGIALVAWLVIALGVVFRQYVTLALTGEVVQANVTATRQWREWVKPKNQAGYWRYHYELRAEADGTVVTDEVSREVYNYASMGQLPRAPFVVSLISSGTHQFGNEVHTNEGRLVISMLVMIVFAIVYPSVAVSTRPWYQRKKVRNQATGTIADGDARAAAGKR
jgi:heme/copper-type cytochrome/quinol oxidase subunit 2